MGVADEVAKQIVEAGFASAERVVRLKLAGMTLSRPGGASRAVREVKYRNPIPGKVGNPPQEGFYLDELTIYCTE